MSDWYFAFACLGWLAGWLFIFRIPLCRTGGASAYPAVTVIIPARDEEANLPRLLGSLPRSELCPAQVLVVDDASSDRTAEMARQYGATVISAAPVPAGWIGKTWPCQVGARRAQGEVLLFLDADVWFEPDGYAKLLDTFLGGPGALSVAPYHITRRFHETFSSFFNLMQMGGTNAFTPWTRRTSPAGLFGPCLVIRRSDYLRTGGHEAVRTQVLENFAFGRILLRQGIACRLRGGRGALNTRMYPTGWRDLCAGWSKAFTAGANASPLSARVLVSFWIGGLIVTTAVTAVACLKPGHPNLNVWWVVYTAYVLQIYRHLHLIGEFPWWTAPVYPLPLAFFLALFISAVLFPGRARWKGRAMPRG